MSPLSAPLLRPHSDGSSMHVTNPNPDLGEAVSVFVRTPDHGECGPARAVWVRTSYDGDPQFVEARRDRRVRGEQWWRADITVRNPLTRYSFVVESPEAVRWVGAAGVSRRPRPRACDFVLLAGSPAPEWSADAVVYQVFVDRFARSAWADRRECPPWAVPAAWDDPVIGRGPEAPLQFYGGDLDGLVEHLDHVAALGANVLYLTPVFPAPSNHRYNATTFDTVDPLLGGDSAYARLCGEVHRRGWRILGDLTMNHVGDQHEWFQRALAAPEAPEHDMFCFDAGLDSGYEAWAGVSTLPRLDWRSDLLRSRMIDAPDAVVRRWLGAPYAQDGWRIDVGHMVGRRGPHDLSGEIAASVRQAVEEAGEAPLLIAEHGDDAAADLLGRGWHGAMAYTGFTQAVWSWLRDADVDTCLLGSPVPVPRLSGMDAIATLRSHMAVTPWVSWARSWNLLGSHDTARIRSVLPGPAEVEVAAGLMMTLPGVPMIFAGDEIGLTGRWGEDARRPMPWSTPQSWDASTWRCFQGLIALRRKHPALRHGGLRWAHVGADAVSFVRETGEERLLIHATRATTGPVELPSRPLGTLRDAATVLYGDVPDLAPHPHRTALPVDGPAFRVWRLPG